MKNIEIYKKVADSIPYFLKDNIKIANLVNY